MYVACNISSAALVIPFLHCVCYLLFKDNNLLVLDGRAPTWHPHTELLKFMSNILQTPADLILEQIVIHDCLFIDNIQ